MDEIKEEHTHNDMDKILVVSLHFTTTKNNIHPSVINEYSVIGSLWGSLLRF